MSDVLTAVLRIKFACVVGQETVPAVLSHTSFSHTAQPRTHQTVPEVRLDEDFHDSGDAGGLHVGESMS